MDDDAFFGSDGTCFPDLNAGIQQIDTGIPGDCENWLLEGLSSMSVLLICGDRSSDHEHVLQTLLAAGLVEAKPSKREQLTAVEIGAGICGAFDIDSSNPKQIEQIRPGKVWQALSVDLMLANLSSGDWGWADPNLIYVLDYWRDFDPLVKFVLVYSSPGRAIAELVSKGEIGEEQVAAKLALWQAVSEELLSFHLANKDRSLLVNADFVRNNTEFFAGLVRDHLKAKRLGKVRELPNGSQEKAAVFDLVATSFVDEDAVAQTIYQELESAADIPGSLNAATGDGAKLGPAHNMLMSLSPSVRSTQRDLALRVWREFQKMREEVECTRNDLEESKKSYREQLQKSEALLVQLHEVQEELEKTFGEVERKNAALGSDYAKLSADLDAKSAEYGKLEGKMKALGDENALILQQLHQVQEELEHYFQKYQVLSSTKPPGAAPAKVGVRDATVAYDTVVDMRNFVDGQNWYNAEHDGRWTGPTEVSTLRLPAVAAGDYRLEFDIVDAMSRDILTGLSVKLDGKPLKLRGSKVFSGSKLRLPFMRRRKLTYPQVVTADVRLDGTGRGSELEFTVPETISPVLRGSRDDRHLGIRLRKIAIVRK